MGFKTNWFWFFSFNSQFLYDRLQKKIIFSVYFQTIAKILSALLSFFFKWSLCIGRSLFYKIHKH